MISYCVFFRNVADTDSGGVDAKVIGNCFRISLGE